jgi:hypothetical protein
LCLLEALREANGALLLSNFKRKGLRSVFCILDREAL